MRTSNNLMTRVAILDELPSMTTFSLFKQETMVLHYLMTVMYLMTVTYLTQENDINHIRLNKQHLLPCITYYVTYLYFSHIERPQNNCLQCFGWKYLWNLHHRNIFKYVTFSSSNYASSLCCSSCMEISLFNQSSLFQP